MKELGEVKWFAFETSGYDEPLPDEMSGGFVRIVNLPQLEIDPDISMRTITMGGMKHGNSTIVVIEPYVRVEL